MEQDKGIPSRKENYLDAFDRGELASKGEDLYEALFFEPFYQLMRQECAALGPPSKALLVPA